MKVLLDTNIIMDDALEREPFWETSEQVLLLVEQSLRVIFLLQLLVICITSSVRQEVEFGRLTI